jgi:hypothetical protein
LTLFYLARPKTSPVDSFFLFLSIGGKIRLRFSATDGKKLTPSHNHCQTPYKKTAKKMQRRVSEQVNLAEHFHENCLFSYGYKSVT